MTTPQVMENARFVKDPRARVYVDVDWSAWLEAENATLDESEWEAPDGITTDGPTVNGGIVRLYVSGGTAGTSYVLRNTITTDNGLIDSRSLTVRVRDR